MSLTAPNLTSTATQSRPGDRVPGRKSYGVACNRHREHLLEWFSRFSARTTNSGQSHKSSKILRIGAYVGLCRRSLRNTEYLCLHPSCNYTTHSYSTNLRNHLFSHFGPNPFICGRCDYRSERFDSLRKHCRVHTG